MKCCVHTKPICECLWHLKSDGWRPESQRGKKQVGSALMGLGETCSDCPLDAEDFRAQQCSAYNDVQYQGCYYEWLPQYNDPAAHCMLRCQAQGQNFVPDGTQCTADPLDMCISGIYQVSHTSFPDPWLQSVPRPLSVKITFLFCTSVHADEILSLRILM
ncbi:hypothetical protein FD755_006179 [Muntiacus reevesi]|uniref:ADAMTS cysteine-rich domain-containing protein n=1 Tax=Muntiacus reevesi TaxID=9886 RepID=A0A5J5MXW1_MUNRE|nr:hypothetical protein FD755_006179 [Muntiacus reevesi]